MNERLEALTNPNLIEDLYLDWKAHQLSLYMYSVAYAWKRWIRIV